MNFLTTRLAIDDFILEMMRIPSSHLQPSQLENWVSRLDVNDDLIQHHICFCDRGYTRNLVCRTPRFDMVILCWEPGQVSTIHDHAGSLNVTRIYSGTLTSRFFQVYDKTLTRRSPCQVAREEQFGTDLLVCVDRHEIHQLANTSDGKVVTLHVYAPPLLNITVYCPESGKAERIPVKYTLEEDSASVSELMNQK